MKRLLSWTFALAVIAGATNASADWDDDDSSQDIAEPEPARLTAIVSGSDVTLTVLLGTATEGAAPRIGEVVWVRRNGTDVVDGSAWTAEDGVATPDGVEFEVVDQAVATGCVQYSLDGPTSSYETLDVAVGGASCDSSGGHTDGGGCSIGGVPASRFGLAAGMLGAGLFTLVVRRRRAS